MLRKVMWLKSSGGADNAMVILALAFRGYIRVHQTEALSAVESMRIVTEPAFEITAVKPC